MSLDPKPVIQDFKTNADLSTEAPTQDKRLGKMRTKGDHRLLQMRNYVAVDPRLLPPKTTFWDRRADFKQRTFGNREHGCCTRASQAILAMRMERIETRQTPLITDDEVLRVYYEMTTRYYGGGDVGAYELDALSDWRKPDYSFRRATGGKEPLTITAFTAVNHRSMDDIKTAIHLGEAKGIKVCFSLPWAWSRIDPPQVWPSPPGSAIGDWGVGSWGGHSLTADAYNETGVRVVHSWYEAGYDEQVISWPAFMMYCDEAYLVIDTKDWWRHRASVTDLQLSVDGIIYDANKVSSYKVPA